MDSDTDDDTIMDGEEVGQTDQPRDTDGDGTIDALDTDSDGDGLMDIEEAGDDSIFTKPRDTDGDGVDDYRDLDSDNGGVSDYTEVFEHNTDPLDPLDDGYGWLEEGARISGGSTSCSTTNGSEFSFVALLILAWIGGNYRHRSTDKTWIFIVIAGFLLIGFMSTDLTAAPHPDA